jgi:DNA-binding response OmpR family regulator
MEYSEPMPTILIIEDDAYLSQFLRNELEADGYKVEIAGDGERGLEILTNRPIDLVILDILMPKMDGITMATQYKQATFKTVPIIILTNLTATSFPDFVNLFLIKSNTDIKTIKKAVNKLLNP